MCYYQMNSKMNVHEVTSISNSKARISTTAPLSKAISQDAATGCIAASEPTLQRKWNRNSKLNFLSSLPASCSRRCNGTPAHDEMIKTGGHIEESTAPPVCLLSVHAYGDCHEQIDVGDSVSNLASPNFDETTPSCKGKTEKLHRNKRFLTQSVAEETQSNLRFRQFDTISTLGQEAIRWRHH